MTETIVEETQREAIINRPYNLAGSIKRVDSERFNVTKESVSWGKTSTVPALLKLFMESLDNPIDVHIKSGECNKIDIEVNANSIRIKDNGHGVHTGVDEDGESILYKAFCKYNTSSNYTEKKGQGQKGINGIGVKLCTTLSSKFEVSSQDSKGRRKIVATENNLNHKETMLTSYPDKTGVEVYFEPDWKIFEVDEIDQQHIDRMYEYVLMQALTYQDIKFTFNKKRVAIKPKQFMKLLGEHAVIEETDDYFFGVVHNDYGDFKQLSYVNGLEISKGGTHIAVLIDQVTDTVHTKLVRKYKSIKKADIKSKMTLVLIAKNMHHIDWEGQVKNTITSPYAKMKRFFDATDLEKFAKKVLWNKEIIDPIVDYFKIKEEFQKKKDLKQLKKKVKVSSDKYLKSIGKQKYLFIAEGQSATGGLVDPIGRQESSFYSLKGKPLNAYSSSAQKFTANKELSELYSIIQQDEGYEYIIPATDQDLDGIHIRGLLIGFIHKYLPEYKHKVGLLNTPVIVVKKGKKIVRWYYSLNDTVELKAGETSQYYKGLGTFNTEDLEFIIKAEGGIQNMIKMLKFDEEYEKQVDDWLGDDSAPRKNYIMNNTFSIAKL